MAGNSKNNKSKKNAKNSKPKENESNVRTGKFEKSGSNANDSSSSQPIKIQMSFTTTAMLNNENSYRSVPNSICCNKENMLKCQLFHGDLVIVQSVIEGKRYFCCMKDWWLWSEMIILGCRIYYVPSVPNTNILCSKDVLRVLSPTFKSVPATVFKLAPGSAIVQASECVLEVWRTTASQIRCRSVPKKEPPNNPPWTTQTSMHTSRWNCTIVCVWRIRCWWLRFRAYR